MAPRMPAAMPGKKPARTAGTGKLLQVLSGPLPPRGMAAEEVVGVSEGVAVSEDLDVVGVAGSLVGSGAFVGAGSLVGSGGGVWLAEVEGGAAEEVGGDVELELEGFGAANNF